MPKVPWEIVILADRRKRQNIKAIYFPFFLRRCRCFLCRKQKPYYKSRLHLHMILWFENSLNYIRNYEYMLIKNSNKMIQRGNNSLWEREGICNFCHHDCVSDNLIISWSIFGSVSLVSLCGYSASLFWGDLWRGRASWMT